MIIAHCLGCYFYRIGNSPLKSQHNSWVVLYGLVDCSVSEKYVTSLYWSITTMATVGYGDMRAENTLERLFNSLIMLIGAGLYAYNINEVLSFSFFPMAIP